MRREEACSITIFPPRRRRPVWPFALAGAVLYLATMLLLGVAHG